MGDGALRGRIEKQVDALGLRNQVRFTGLVPPDQVPRYLGVMDCLVHLSRREALSRALPQALAAGRPVVAYDFDGADEVCLDDRTGFLVRTGDVAAVCNRLRQLATRPDLRQRLGEQGQAFVREHFSAERLVQDQLNLYRSLAVQHGIQ